MIKVHQKLCSIPHVQYSNPRDDNKSNNNSNNNNNNNKNINKNNNNDNNKMLWRATNADMVEEFEYPMPMKCLRWQTAK